MTLFCDFLFMVSQFCLLKREPFPLRALQPQGPQPTVLAWWHFMTVGWEGQLMAREAALWHWDHPEPFCVADLATLHVYVSQINTYIWGKNECLESRHRDVIWSMKMKEHVSVQQQHFLYNLLAIQDACVMMIRSLTYIWKLMIMEAYTGRTYSCILSVYPIAFQEIQQLAWS